MGASPSVVRPQVAPSDDHHADAPAGARPVRTAAGAGDADGRACPTPGEDVRRDVAVRVRGLEPGAPAQSRPSAERRTTGDPNRTPAAIHPSPGPGRRAQAVRRVAVALGRDRLPRRAVRRRAQHQTIRVERERSSSGTRPGWRPLRRAYASGVVGSSARRTQVSPSSDRRTTVRVGIPQEAVAEDRADRHERLVGRRHVDQRDAVERDIVGDPSPRQAVRREPQRAALTRPGRSATPTATNPRAPPATATARSEPNPAGVSGNDVSVHVTSGQPGTWTRTGGGVGSADGDGDGGVLQATTRPSAPSAIERIAIPSRRRRPECVFLDPDSSIRRNSTRVATMDQRRTMDPLPLGRPRGTDTDPYRPRSLPFGLSFGGHDDRPRLDRHRSAPARPRRGRCRLRRGGRTGPDGGVGHPRCSTATCRCGPTIRPSGEAIAERLGWLDAPAHFTEQIPALEGFGDGIVDDGFTTAIVAGMGGSSLAPDVLHRTFGTQEGYLDLRILDSTDPAAVAAVLDDLDPLRTLVDRRQQVRAPRPSRTRSSRTPGRGREEALAPGRAPRLRPAGRVHRASPTRARASRRSPTTTTFREVFLNPPDIGGRY